MWPPGGSAVIGLEPSKCNGRTILRDLSDDTNAHELQDLVVFARPLRR
jgi:hypothetical protein